MRCLCGRRFAEILDLVRRAGLALPSGRWQGEPCPTGSARRRSRTIEGPGKDSPMPCLLNLIYAMLLRRVPRSCSTARSGPGSTARGGARSSWAGPLTGSATALASGSTRSASARSCCSGRSSQELARRRPGWEAVISTTTRTGLATARQSYPDLVTFYAPLDFSWSTRRAVARIRPTVLALVELELWPNLVRAAKESGARVAIVNGRLSHRSHRAIGGSGGRSARPSAGSTPSRPRTRSTPTGSSTSACPGAGSG